MGWFDDETTATPTHDGQWTLAMATAWNIGDNANGGYALSPVLRTLRDLGTHPDPLSVTTHFMRPVRGGADANVSAELIRQGRTTTVGRGTLTQSGTDRLAMIAAFGDLSEMVGVDHELTVPPPSDLPSPDDCLERSNLEQGVVLPILERLDVRIHPSRAIGGGTTEAVVEGWIRFGDGTQPSSLALPLFADAFPPALYPLVGRVGWVPTLELTVQVRRRPAPGWIHARFECDDLVNGRMIETGSLWDSTGALVARSRQLGLLLTA